MTCVVAPHCNRCTRSVRHPPHAPLGWDLRARSHRLWPKIEPIGPHNALFQYEVAVRPPFTATLHDDECIAGTFVKVEARQRRDCYTLRVPQNCRCTSVVHLLPSGRQLVPLCRSHVQHRFVYEKVKRRDGADCVEGGGNVDARQLNNIVEDTLRSDRSSGKIAIHKSNLISMTRRAEGVEEISGEEG